MTSISYDGKTLSKMNSMNFGYGEGYYVDAEKNVISLNPSIGYTAKDLVIYAENDKNLTLSVVSGGFMQPPVITIKENTPTAPEQPTEKSDAPTVAKIEKGNSLLFDYYRVSFNSDVAAYLGKVSGGAINSTPLTLASSSLYHETNAFKVSTDDSYGVMSLQMATKTLPSPSTKTAI